MQSIVRWILVFTGLCLSSTAPAQTLDTVPPNNGSGGVFLDLQATNGPLDITGFDAAVNGTAGITVSVEVWVRSGSYVGFTGSSAGWTLSQVATGVSRGSLENTPFMLGTPITVAPAQTTAVYLHSITGGSGLRYTGVSGDPPQTSFSNGDLALFSDTARTGNVPFAGNVFTPRAFSGTIRYTNALQTTVPNNGDGGVFMNLQAVDRTIAVTGFDVSLESVAGTTTSIEVWTRPGSYVGFTSSNAGWTLSQSVTGQSAGPETPARFSLSQPITVTANAPVAVYLHSVTASGGILYAGTSGDPPQTLWSNNDLVMFSDRAVTGTVAFANSQFTPRTFAGNLRYTKAFTTARSNNGDGGVFMDLDPRDAGLFLTGFDVPLFGAPGVLASVEVWTRPGSYAGFTGSNAGWTLHTTATGLTQGSLVLTPFLFSPPITLGPEGITAVYLHSVTPGAGINYTGTGGSPPQTTWINSDLTMFSDVGRAGVVPFGGSSFTPRTFSGVLRYRSDRMFGDGFE